MRISAREGCIHVEGDESAVARATEVLQKLQDQVARDGELSPDDVSRLVADLRDGQPYANVPAIPVYTGRQVRPRTPGQAQYLTAIRDNDLVLCSGPAGTEKTYLAVAMAVAALRQETVRKIVLVRPAVEAGESLGFLPGDLQAKINPYLRPLMDALHEMIDHDAIKRYTEQDVIEVIPLAYMRGRTLSEAFMILDEAQNTTIAQMKMFLTRMGNNTKIVVSGDTTQIDLPAHARSGLIDAETRLAASAEWASSSCTSPTSCGTRWFRKSSRPTTINRSGITQADGSRWPPAVSEGHDRNGLPRWNCTRGPGTARGRISGGAMRWRGLRCASPQP